MNNRCTGLVNGTVVTMDDRVMKCEALAWEGDRLIHVGSREEVEAVVGGKHGTLIDLKGATVLPGFCDAHVHLMTTGLNTYAVDLYHCTSVKEVLDLVQDTAAGLEPGQWVYGKRLEEVKLKEKRPPFLTELDEVAPDHPVILVDRGMHYKIVNTMGREQLNLPDSIEFRGGSHTGRLQAGRGGHSIEKFYDALGEGLRREAVRRFGKMAVQKGVTTVHALDGGEIFSDSDIDIIESEAPDLPLRVVIFWNTTDIAKVRDAGYQRAGGCILIDGSIGSRTACFDEPYADDPSTKGVLNYTDQQIIEMMTTGHRAGMQLAFHTIGTTAIRQALNCYEAILTRYPAPGHRHRLEHFGVPSREDINRAAALGIIISTQPAFAYLRGGPGKVYETRLGPEREKRAYPLRDLLAAGLLVAGGSDADVTPVDPLLGIHSCVNHPHVEQRLGVEEALRLFTINGAISARQEGDLGSITPGKLADLVVLGQNPFLVSAAGLKDIPVLATIKGGEFVYRDKDWFV